MYNNVGSGSKIDDDAFLLMQAAHFSSATTNVWFHLLRILPPIFGGRGGDWETFCVRSASCINYRVSDCTYRSTNFSSFVRWSPVDPG